MAVALLRSGSDVWSNSPTYEPSFASVQAATGDVIQVAYAYRGNDSALIAAPTWSGETFTELYNADFSGSSEVRVQVFQLVVVSGDTATIAASNSQYKVTSGGYAVFGEANTTTPNGTPQSQTKWAEAGWTNPSLTVTGATGDLFVEWILTSCWNENYGDTGATWAPGASQTEAFEVDNTASPKPRVVLATKAGSASENLTYTASAGAPGYAHYAVAIKAAASGAGVVPFNRSQMSGGMQSMSGGMRAYRRNRSHVFVPELPSGWRTRASGLCVRA